jgi:hypothetical protein
MERTIKLTWATEAGYRAAIIESYCSLYSTLKPAGLLADRWLCGYVEVTPEHPLYHCAYNEHVDALIPAWERAMLGPSGKRSVFSILFAGSGEARADVVFDVHGSVTFSGELKSFPDGSWWFGFDCHHAGDTPEKCDIDYVRSQCESLARQLLEVEEERGNRQPQTTESSK